MQKNECKKLRTKFLSEWRFTMIKLLINCISNRKVVHLIPYFLLLQCSECMRNSYLIYFLSLISAYMVYFMFGLMLTVDAGVDAVPEISFFASIFHFGISSW